MFTSSVICIDVLLICSHLSFRLCKNCASANSFVEMLIFSRVSILLWVDFSVIYEYVTGMNLNANYLHFN